MIHVTRSRGASLAWIPPTPPECRNNAHQARPIDFRSDTVTRPTPAMRGAMAAAEVGDDVFGDDPTVNQLQAARSPSCWARRRPCSSPPGTMSNLIGVRLHCRPGDELICEADCHIYNYEQAAPRRSAAWRARPLPGRVRHPAT